jgi:transposase
MDRHGRGSLRRLLYMCALVALRWDPHMHAWAQRLKARGKPTKVVLVAVMRKLLQIMYGVWKHACDYDAHLAFSSACSLRYNWPEADYHHSSSSRANTAGVLAKAMVCLF